MDINTCTLSGRLVRDPEAKGSVTRLRLAFETRSKDASGAYQNKSNFLDLSAFGKTAETATAYLAKGSPIVVTGNLEHNEWTDAQGAKRSEIRLLIRDLKLPPKGENGATRAVAEVAESSRLPF